MNCVTPLVLEISPTMICGGKRKNCKEKMMKEILNTMCAFLNSSGGVLVLPYDEIPTEKDVHDCVRMIEQRFIQTTSCSTVCNGLDIEVQDEGLAITVKGSNYLTTSVYNLYLPSVTQIMGLPSSEPVNHIVDIMNGMKTPLGGGVKMGSHCKEFIKDQKITCGIMESKSLQFKELKSKPSKCVTLADRIVQKTNKLTGYVSGFANHKGGHIFYGVSDDGTVVGEAILPGDVAKIIKKVFDVVNRKMIWPQPPKRGKDWQIYFEPVKNTQGKQIQNLFVIVIYVSPYPGGVFAEAPECWHLKKGKVEKMTYWQWYTCFFRSVGVEPSGASYLCEKKRFLRRLVQSRNNQDMVTFSKEIEKGEAEFCGSDIHFIEECEKAIHVMKERRFQKAEDLLRELEKHMKYSSGKLEKEVRVAYLKSCLESGRERFLESYAIAKHGLQQVHLIQDDFLKVWFFMHAAMLAIILSCDKLASESLRDEAQRFLGEASKYAKAVDDSEDELSDLQRKLRIYKALVYLGCSFSGRAVEDRRVTEGDVEAAKNELTLVHNSVTKEHPLSHYRKFQFLLAECDLLRRGTCDCQDVPYEKLKRAYKLADEARLLAKKFRFLQVRPYANSRRAELTEKLICIAYNDSVVKQNSR